MRKYIITIYSTLSSDTVLCRTVKSRYASEQDVVSSLSLKLLEPRVQQVSFEHIANNEIHVDIRLASDDADAARLLVYGHGYAGEEH